MAEPMPAVTSSNYTQTNKELTLQLPLGAGVRAKQARHCLCRVGVAPLWPHSVSFAQQPAWLEACHLGAEMHVPSAA